MGAGSEVRRWPRSCRQRATAIPSSGTKGLSSDAHPPNETTSFSWSTLDSGREAEARRQEMKRGRTAAAGGPAQLFSCHNTCIVY